MTASAYLCDARAKPIGVIALVGQQMFEGNAADQVLGLENVVHLTTGEDEANGVARLSHGPALILASRSLGERPIASSRLPSTRRHRLAVRGGGMPCGVDDQHPQLRTFSMNALKTRSQTPFFSASGEKCWKTAVPVAYVQRTIR